MTAADRPVIVVEDDPFTRIVGVTLDPTTSQERLDAFAEFFRHDLPDFPAWCKAVRAAAPALWPADVRLVDTQEELRAALPDAVAVVTEALEVGPAELAAAPNLRVVQKFGANLRGIDVAGCEARGVQVRTIRRRANIACAEQTMALMLTFAKRLHEIRGLISMEQLTAAGFKPGAFDRRHTAMSGWARISGLKMLHESTLGIIGLGEIGRELALRAAAFGMRVLYYQRNPLSAADEQQWHASYAPLETLLAESDYVSLQLPRGGGTKGFLNAERLAMMRPDAFLIDTAQADHVDRTALLDALRAGRLAGFALDPLYEEPGRPDDELLAFPNVILTPHTAAQPRFNALNDLRDMMVGMGQAVGG